MNEKLNCFGACSEEKSKMNNCNCPVKETETLQSLQSCVSVSVTDLRIGNLLLFEENEIIVSGLNKSFIYWGKSNFAPLLLNCFKPIQLTEERLISFGNAEIKPFGLGVEILERFIFIWKESYKYWYVVTKESKEYLTKIEFIHEYQNFIFALNGSELQVGNLTEH